MRLKAATFCHKSQVATLWQSVQFLTKYCALKPESGFPLPSACDRGPKFGTFSIKKSQISESQIWDLYRKRWIPDCICYYQVAHIWRWRKYEAAVGIVVKQLLVQQLELLSFDLSS